MARGRLLSQFNTSDLRLCGILAAIDGIQLCDEAYAGGLPAFVARLVYPPIHAVHST